MRIKTNPEDFRVEEKISLALGQGNFAVYRLTKRNWNTIDAIRAACDAKKVPFEKVRYGGRKDKQALTKQFLTCPKEFDLSFKRHNVELQLAGYSSEQMSPSKIACNKFEIIVRDMTADEAAEFAQKIREAERDGFVNYFDEQRFGGSEKFLAELLIKRQFAAALRMWDSKLPPNDPILALRKMPREEFGMFLSAYQSYIWNEVCAQILELGIEATEIPTIASELLPTSSEVTKIIVETLGARGVRLSKLKLSEFKKCGYFSSFMRKIKIFPQELEIFEDSDELFENKQKISLKFSLAPGSYATMLLKV